MGVELDKGQIEEFLDAARDRLTGDWVLVGGALAAVWFSPERKTEDVDLVSVAGPPDARLQLMELAHALGLPIEAVNSAADFFLRRIDGWNEGLVTLREGANCRIFRVTPTVFMCMKLARLSEDDLRDCLELISTCGGSATPLDRGRIRREIARLPATENEGMAARREKLSEALEFE